MKKYVLLSMLIMLSISSKAQSWSDLFNKDNISKVASAVTGQIMPVNLVGVWQYDGSAVELKSSNVAKSVGGKLATSTIESKLDKQFAKLGLQKGAASFDFKADSTFTVTAKNKTQKGTYSYDKANSKLILKFAGKASLAANMSATNNQITLTFEANKLVDAVSYISKFANNSSLNTLTSLLSSYDDVRTGFVLTRKE